MNNGIKEACEHKLSVDRRKTAELTGIKYVESFEPTEIIAAYDMGDIAIEGEELKIINFSVDTGRLSVVGKINGIFYMENTPKTKGGLFSKGRK